MKLPRIFHSKLFLGLVVIVLLGVFALELQQWRERRAINNEIAHLVNEQQDLEQKNNALAQSLEYFSSDDYKEKLARQQLGLRKDGEIVVNFPKPSSNTSTSDQARNESNPQKWWRYVFLKNHN